MPFEKFIPPRKQKPPRVSIKRTGTISFDKALAEAYGLAKATHVTLFFDTARKRVGVRAAGPKEEGALKLSHRLRVSSVRARAFFDAFRVKLEQTARFQVDFDKSSGMAVIELGEVKRRPGRRKSR